MLYKVGTLVETINCQLVIVSDVNEGIQGFSLFLNSLFSLKQILFIIYLLSLSSIPPSFLKHLNLPLNYQNFELILSDR